MTHSWLGYFLIIATDEEDINHLYQLSVKKDARAEFDEIVKEHGWTPFTKVQAIKLGNDKVQCLAKV